MTSAPPSWLQRVAERARREPGLVGHALANYQTQRGIDDLMLSAELDCDPARLSRLKLCRLPRSTRFREDVVIIATEVGIDPIRLAHVLRLADALAAFTDVTNQSALRAARLHDDQNTLPPDADPTKGS